MRRSEDRSSAAFASPSLTVLDDLVQSISARGFLAVGGYDVISPEGFKTPAEAVDAFAQSNSRVAVICSVDANYPALVPPIAKGIRSRCPGAVILLAGFPQDQVEAHKQAGVDDFIHVRADVLEFITRLNSRLGI